MLINKEFKIAPTIAIIVGILLLMTSSYLGNWDNTIFGFQPRNEYKNALHSILSIISLGLGFSMLFYRNKLTTRVISKLLLFSFSIFMFLFGWNLTSIGVTNQNIQNDGFNVTGGFMMFFSGLLFGYFNSSKNYNNNKKISK